MDNVPVEQQNNIPVINPSDSPVQAIAALAMSGASTAVIEQMKGLAEWDDARRAKAEFNAAFSKAKKEFKQAKKSGYNSHISSHYSKLCDYEEATREGLSQNGLSWRHVLKAVGPELFVECIIAHESGHFESSELSAPSNSMMNKMVNPLQSVGIVTTYLKRMTLSALLGIVSEEEFDNDGNGGAPAQPKSKAPAPRQQQNGQSVKPNHCKLLRAKLTNSGKSEVDLCIHCNVTSLENLSMDQLNDAIAWATN